MPRIPRKIRIGHFIVQVKVVNPKSMIYDDSFGEMNYEKLEIKIDKTSAAAMQYSTFIHELLEAINYIYELKLPHHKLTTLEAALQDIEPVDDE